MHTDTSAREMAGPIKHLIVYQERGRFCGWPANNGIWSWEDEILVGFSLGYYKESETSHSIDRDKPREQVMARSLDGGESWRLKGPKSLLPRSSASPEEINFTHPDFVMQCGGSEFYISYDRGKTWQGAYKFPDFDRGYPLELMARTDYIVNDQDDCLIFLTASKPNGKEGRPFCTRTRDGGKTFDFVSWITPEPPTVGDIRAFSIMPSSVRCSENQIISAIRKHYDRVSWIDVYVSYQFPI